MVLRCSGLAFFTPASSSPAISAPPLSSPAFQILLLETALFDDILHMKCLFEVNCVSVQLARRVFHQVCQVDTSKAVDRHYVKPVNACKCAVQASLIHICMYFVIKDSHVIRNTKVHILKTQR